MAHRPAVYAKIVRVGDNSKQRRNIKMPPSKILSRDRVEAECNLTRTFAIGSSYPNDVGLLEKSCRKTEDNPGQGDNTEMRGRRGGGNGLQGALDDRENLFAAGGDGQEERVNFM